MISGEKASSDNNMVHKERTMRSALSWRFDRFRHRLRIKRPTSEADRSTSTKESDCKSKPQASFLKCDLRQVKSMHRLGRNSATMTAEELGTSKTFAHSTGQSQNRPTSLNVDIQLRTGETFGAMKSTDPLEIGHMQTESGKKLPHRFAVGLNESNAQNVLDQIVTFLAYDMDPFIIEEFRHYRRLHRKGIEIVSDFLASDSNSIGSMRNFLSGLLRDPLSEDYRLLCDLLRDQGNEPYIADFLETFSILKRLQNASDGKDDATISSDLFSSTSVSDQLSKQFSECSCIYQEEFSRKDQRFDVSLVYVDRESRAAQSFKGVASMKRRKHRKSRIELDHTKVRLGDTSDRYIPMISVHLYRQCLCDARMRTLQRLMETCPCIRDLCIVKTRLEDQAKIRLGRALEQNVGLYQLDLSLSALCNDGALYVADALRSNRFLRILNISSNELTHRGCDFLVKGLLKNRTLNDLDLGFNEIGDQGSISLAGALQISKCSLQRLRLRSNGITSRGATALFAALRKNSRLCLLDMCGNDICDDCLGTLSDALIYNRTLTDLVIDKCRVSRIGCSNLARPLKINTVLKRLSLNMNPIGDAGIKTLVDGIKYNRSVAEISLNMCGITNSGLWHLLDAMRYNSTMKTIKLCYNLIEFGAQPKYGVHALREVVERRSSAFIGQNVTSGHSPKAERRSSLLVERRRIISMDESRSGTFVGHNDSPTDGISKSELYAKLLEVLHNNSPLKVVLWGNRLDDINPAISETLITNAFSY